MSYVGVKSLSGRHIFEIKLHGPVDEFNIDPKDIRDKTHDSIAKHNDKPLSSLCRVVADDLRREFLDGKDLVWVEVNLQTAGNVLYGASAEVV